MIMEHNKQIYYLTIQELIKNKKERFKTVNF